VTPAEAVLNYLTIKEAEPHKSLPKLWVFVGVSLYIIIITGRNSDAAIIWAVREALSAPFCVLMGLQRRVHAAHWRARVAKTH
jgi:hypothetical protein